MRFLLVRSDQFKGDLLRFGFVYRPEKDEENDGGHQKGGGWVLFGWQTGPAVYPGSGSGHVYRLNKKTGKVELTCKADSGVLSNAASPDDRFVFAGDSDSTVYCFDDKGKRLWALGTGCGSASRRASGSAARTGRS